MTSAAAPDTPPSEPVAVIGVFRSRVDPQDAAEFDERYADLSAHIATIDGYLGHKVFVADDGEQCLVVEFATREGFDAWDTDPQHKEAKARGKVAVFASYDVKVGTVFEHHAKA